MDADARVAILDALLRAPTSSVPATCPWVSWTCLALIGVAFPFGILFGVVSLALALYYRWIPGVRLQHQPSANRLAQARLGGYLKG